jgi:hypothetical protein
MVVEVMVVESTELEMTVCPIQVVVVVVVVVQVSVVTAVPALSSFGTGFKKPNEDGKRPVP